MVAYTVVLVILESTASILGRLYAEGPAHRSVAGPLGTSVAEGKAPLTVNATAGRATNLGADKVDGKSGEEFVRRDPATAQGGSLHVDGLGRSGSETNTSESPDTGRGALGTRAS
jgi:hypothetical protein